jgi:hypothetical protein
MKIILISILLIMLLVIPAATSTKQNNRNVEIDNIIVKNEEHIYKANVVVKIADKQQKEKMEALHKAVQKLKKEKKVLENKLQLTKSTNIVYIDTLSLK